MNTSVRLRGRRQKALFEALWCEGDVPIDKLFRVVGGSPIRYRNARARQWWLGPYLTNLNRGLATHGLIAKPGIARRTYRLVQI